jgi:hypothetical protein
MDHDKEKKKQHNHNHSHGKKDEGGDNVSDLDEDNHEENAVGEDDDEVGSQGDRGNLIYTIARVNPSDFVPGNVFVDASSNEVEIVNLLGALVHATKRKAAGKRDAWVLDDRWVCPMLVVLY